LDDYQLEVENLKIETKNIHHTILMRWTKLPFLDLFVGARNNFGDSVSEITLRRSKNYPARRQCTNAVDGEISYSTSLV